MGVFLVHTDRDFYRIGRYQHLDYGSFVRHERWIDNTTAERNIHFDQSSDSVDRQQIWQCDHQSLFEYDSPNRAAARRAAHRPGHVNRPSIGCSRLGAR